MKVGGFASVVGFVYTFFYKNLVYKNMKLDFWGITRTRSALDLVKILENKGKFMEK